MKQTWSPEPSLGELFSDLTRETKLLVRKEVQLAKLELKENAMRMGKGAGFIGAGAVLGIAAFLSFLAGVIALLSTFMPVWVSALIVALVVGVIGLMVAKRGMNIIKQSELAPREAIDSVREDVLWLKKRA
jgi:Putative Actinobacterial Holin-X, holin superfamily III